MTGTEVFSIFASLGLDTSEFDSNLSDAESAGSGFGTSFEGVVKKAKNALVTAGLVTAIKNVATSIWSLANESASYADNINKTAKTIGISTTAYQKLDFVMRHAGSGMQENKNAFKTFREGIASAGDETSTFSKALAEMSDLGIDVQVDPNGDIVEQFLAISSALSMVDDEQKRLSLATKFFGRTGQ